MSHIPFRTNMTRESNPSNPGEDGAWFKMRENNNFIDVPGIQGSVANDPKLGWMALDDFTGHQIPVNALLIEFELKTSDGYDLYLDESSQECAGDNDIVDLDQYGLTSDNAIVIEAYNKSTNEDDNDERDYPDNNLNTKGYWFVVQDEKGNDIDVSNGAQEVSSSDSCLGWNPIPKDSSLPTDRVVSDRIKKEICQSLDLDPEDYKLYASDDNTSVAFDDDSVVDLGLVGLKRNDPMLVKYEPGDSNKNSDSGSESGYGGGQDNGQGNDSDKWVNYTRQVQNITSGDWSTFPGTIRNLQPDEILWTDGNASYSYALSPNITAYQVVRRYPNTPDGAVTEFGLVSASPYYFKLLD